jgi:hypothetical protein
MEGVKNHYKLVVKAGIWSPNIGKKESNKIAASLAEIQL